MICLECGKKLKQISYRHLKLCCSLTPQKYKEKYNIKFLMDKETRNKCSKPGESNGNFKHGKYFIQKQCKKCNTNICNGNISGYCIHCIDRKKEKNSFYEQKHTLKTRKKMKEKAKFRDKSVYYKIQATQEILAKRKKTRAINWNKLSTEEKHKRLKNWIKAGKRKKGTKIEKIIQKVLDDIGMIKDIDYQTNVYISGFNVDFLIHKEFIIECYGDYWHKNPKNYNSPKDIAKRKSDIKRKEFLESKGYTFISFWETDIHNRLELVIKKIEKFFRSYINLFEWESCSH